MVTFFRATALISNGEQIERDYKDASASFQKSYKNMLYYALDSAEAEGAYVQKITVEYVVEE